MKTARRLDHIEPFYVMECAKAAVEIAASPACDPRQGGERMLFLNIGEPDFTAPPLVQEAAQRAIRDGRSQYTQATGLPALREALSQWYRTRFGLDIPARRIVITAGASAALQLACLALFEAGDEVLMPDPSYPCNRHFVAAAEAVARLLPAHAEHRFQLDADAVARAWSPATRGVLLASPSNPTGTSIHPDEMRRIDAVVRGHDGVTIVDEIYLGLSYDETFGHSTLALGEHIISVNSFSKYFNMTGWRLGWLVLPEALVPPVERLAQNLFICASTIAQHAALACFEPESITEYERRRAEFRARRDVVVPALNRLGLKVPVMPDGAFYAYADCSAHSADSWDFCFDLMHRAHVALTPGRDFGRDDPKRWLRLSFANAMPQLEEALQRLARVL
ncbi:pyridoxal phosphate-dependent aminotransferase [Aquabacterium sp.]|uniref:pyridoxal phosphate-dependent aminotransferase n=1 Tax=Aquabacterium sp. TaxID=1872578 RepID=UPI002CEFCDC6|nr:pyridoxal phosphate-dependent aminotransferase [Aquabacterium sp.]HSW07664.1 pyridoxal phosphate-dependent aminotransferase [Aquabacterium sp.]